MDAGTDWHDWVYDPPIRYGLDIVDAYRPDGLYGWDEPKMVEVGRDPLLNVAGLYWRRPQQPFPVKQ